MKPSLFDFVVVHPSEPKIEAWFRAYAKQNALGDVEPAGESWYGLSLGGVLRAVAGEVAIRGGNIKVTNLLAEPSRTGLRAMQAILEMYAELTAHGTVGFVGADILASNHSIKRRCRAAGVKPYSETWYLGSLEEMR